MPVDSVAIVTGASSGIGLGTAVKLAEQGMAVLGTGRDETRLAELVSAVGDPERIETVAVDLTADDGPATVVQHVKAGKIPAQRSTPAGRPAPLGGTAPQA